MDGERRGDVVVVGGDARQRLHDARGYGRPLEGNEIALAPVEAAHLLFRGDLTAVDGDGFVAFFESIQEQGVGARFLTYADLRSRGIYLAPARAGWVTDPHPNADYTVFERGASPPDGTVAHQLRVVGERTTLPARNLGDIALAVVDEEGEVSYFESGRGAPEGTTTFSPPQTAGILLSDRVLVPDPPPGLYDRGFYGQPLQGREEADALQLSLLEAAYLARDVLTIDEGRDEVLQRGRIVEGERFNRRLTVYEALRTGGVVPKTGFKFGADFRTYAEITTVSQLGHSEMLVWVLPGEYAFEPRELALYIRLAGGVRKQAMFALVRDGGDVEWITVGRLTP